MTTHWLLAANEGRARVFEINPTDSTWHEVEDFIFMETHMPNRELASDAQGQMAGFAGGSVHSTSPRSDPHDLATHRFAAALVADLMKAKTEGRFQRLDIAAPPRFLGVLRNALPAALASVLGRELNKDWSHLDASDMARRYVEMRDL